MSPDVKYDDDGNPYVSSMGGGDPGGYVPSKPWDNESAHVDHGSHLTRYDDDETTTPPKEVIHQRIDDIKPNFSKSNKKDLSRIVTSTIIAGVVTTGIIGLSYAVYQYFSN